MPATDERASPLPPRKPVQRGCRRVRPVSWARVRRTACALGAVALVALVALPVLLAGCLAGIRTAQGPEPDASRPAAPLDPGTVYYEVHVRLNWGNGGSPAPRRRKAWSETFRSVLAQDFGIDEPVASRPEGASYLYFRIIETGAEMPPLVVLSGMVSVLTFSLVPGYLSETYRVEVLFEAGSAGGAVLQDVFRYEYTLRSYIWLPLMLHPDATWFGPSEALQRSVLEGVVQRMLRDAQARLAAR